jgi:glyoxylase-like metal-dependent hydrolase (beta-lactamase superfamily II)
MDNISFFDGEEKQTHTYFLYVWLIEGGGYPILVDTGPNPRYLERFNQKTSAYIPGGIQQTTEENTLNALKRYGVEPADIRHVIVTHLHEDHYNYFDAFPNARLVVNKQEFENQRANLAAHIRDVINRRPDCLQLVEDETLVPGIETVPLGSHTVGSQGILVQTWMGNVFITGDVAYLYENIESNRPARNKLDTTEADREENLRALMKIRSLADIIVPAHDPLTLERWGQGIIGGLQRSQ